MVEDTYILKLRCLNCGYMWFGKEEYGKSWDASRRVCGYCGVSHYAPIYNPLGWGEKDRKCWEDQRGRPRIAKRMNKILGASTDRWEVAAWYELKKWMKEELKKCQEEPWLVGTLEFRKHYHYILEKVLNRMAIIADKADYSTLSDLEQTHMQPAEEENKREE